MRTDKNRPMFNVDDAKLKQSIRSFYENGCILCRRRMICQLPQHNNFRFGDPMCPSAEMVSMLDAFFIIWGPALNPEE